MNLRIAHMIRRHKPPKRTYDASLLTQNPKLREKYEDLVTQRLENIMDTNNRTYSYTNIIETTLSAAEIAVPISHGPLSLSLKYKDDDKLQRWIQERMQLIKRLRQSRSKE